MTSPIYVLLDSGDISGYSRDVDRLKTKAQEDANVYDKTIIVWRTEGQRIIGAWSRFKYAFEIHPIKLLED